MNEIISLYSTTQDAKDLFQICRENHLVANPPFLKPGDRVALLSPAGAIDAEWITGATKTLTDWGLQVTVGQHAMAQAGRYAGSAAERLEDFNHALGDVEIKAIFCSRGGYGAVHIVEGINWALLQEWPKWIVGYSDITLLHCAALHAGVASIHGPMAQHLSRQPEAPCTVHLKQILFGQTNPVCANQTALNKEGTTVGQVIGGNLAVMTSMRGTRYDFDYRDKILFIEEIGEPAYKIERMLYQLKLSGVFTQINGLIVGQMTDCADDEKMGATLWEVIRSVCSEVNGPICFNFPVGHEDDNYALVEGVRYRLAVNEAGARLEQLG